VRTRVLIVFIGVALILVAVLLFVVLWNSTEAGPDRRPEGIPPTASSPSPNAVCLL